MVHKKKILAIIGSTRANSSNLKLVEKLVELTTDIFEFTLFEKLSERPTFKETIPH